MGREINEEKRQKFIEYAGKRVNNVLHDIQILEPMARSNTYDFTRKDVEDMFTAMQETLNEAKGEFEKKFDEKARAEKKTFSFATTGNNAIENTTYNNINVGNTTTEPVVNETSITETINYDGNTTLENNIEEIEPTTYNTIEPTTTEVEL